MPVWYVYFLELGNGDIHVGSTDDMRGRFARHQDGYVEATRAHLPVALKSYIAVPTADHARALERYFSSGAGKALARKRFIAA